MKKLDHLLRELGMKEYESKAWTVLLKHGVCTADVVSRISGIPLTRVYETLDNLEKRGLLVVQKTRPKKYRVVSIEALRNLIEEKRSRMASEIKKAEKTLTEIKKLVPKPAEGDHEEEIDTFWIINGRENILRNVVDAIKRAKKEVLIFSDDMSWFDRLESAMKRRLKSGINIKILLNINEHTENVIKEALSIGLKMRGWEMRGLMGTLIDGEMVYLISKIPRQGISEEKYYGVPGSDEIFSYKCLTTRNPIIVRMVRSYFDNFWWRGENPEKTFKI